MTKQKDFMHLLDLLYSCADRESSWNVFVGELRIHLKASLVCISTFDEPQAIVGVDLVEYANYRNHYMRIHPWYTGHSFREGEVLLSEQVLPFNEFRKSVVYNEWAKRNLTTHGIGAAIRLDPSALFLSIARGDAQGPFDEDDRNDVHRLMPHIQRAINLQDRMNALEQRVWAVDVLAFPMMYVGWGGILRWMNGAAEDLLRGCRGLQLRKGRLHAELPSEDTALQKVLKEGRSLTDPNLPGYGGWIRITRLDGSALSLLLTRPPQVMKRKLGLPDRDSGFLIFVALQAVDKHGLSVRLRRTWGLTAAESALAVTLLDSNSLQDAASKLRVSRNTAKSQLSLIFQKSGTRRQSELVRELLAMAVVVSKI